MFEQASKEIEGLSEPGEPASNASKTDVHCPRPSIRGLDLFVAANPRGEPPLLDREEPHSEIFSVENSRSGSSVSLASLSRSSCISRADSAEEKFSIPHGSGIVSARNPTPSPYARKIPQSALRKTCSFVHLPQQQEADPDDAIHQQQETNSDDTIPNHSMVLSLNPSLPENGGNTAKLLQECADRLTARKIEETQAPLPRLNQSFDKTTPLQPSIRSPRAVLNTDQGQSLSNAATVSETEPVAQPSAVSASEPQISAQPRPVSLPINIDQAPNKLSWYGIGRRTIAWINYILTGFDVRDDSQENRVYRLQEKLIAHEIEQILPVKESEVDTTLSTIAHPNDQKTYLLQEILKKENALSITQLHEQEKQRALDETTTEKQNYDSAKAQLVNELNTLYFNKQLADNTEPHQLKKIDSSNITHDEIEALYGQLLSRSNLESPSQLHTTITAAKEKFDTVKKELMSELNNITESQAQKIEYAKITSRHLNELYTKLLNPIDPATASKCHEEIDNLLDKLDDEYDTARKTIIHRHYLENKKADRKQEQSKKTEREKLAYELKLLEEELERKKARYIELLRLLEMDVATLKKNYANHLANAEKEAKKREIRAELELDSLSLDDQELKLKKELDKKDANPSFTKKNVLWGVTQATTTVVAASSGAVTAVACVAITIFTFHISLPLLLLIGWAGYRVNFSVYQDSIKNTLNSIFVTGLFHDPRYPNDLTKKVGLLQKIFISLGTFFAGGTGVSIAAITFTSVSHCVLHLLLLFSFTAAAAIPPVIIPIAGVIAVISLIAITGLMYNTIKNIIKNDNNSINRFCRKLYRKGFEKCCSDAAEDLKFFFQHLTAKDVIHGLVTALFMVVGIAFATLATVALISSWHGSLITFLETTAGIRDIVSNSIANGIALVACYCLTPVARFPVVLEKAAITFGLIAHAICNPRETYNKCANKLYAFKEQAKAECVDVPSTVLFVGKSVLIGTCYLVAITTIVGFIALNAIGNGALADEGGKILDSICGWFGTNLPLVGQDIASFSSAATVSAAFAIVATQDTYGRPVESREIEMKKLSTNNQAIEVNAGLNNKTSNLNDAANQSAAASQTDNPKNRKKLILPPDEADHDSVMARVTPQTEARTQLLDETQSKRTREVYSWLPPGIADIAATVSGMWASPDEDKEPITKVPPRNPAITSYSRIK